MGQETNCRVTWNGHAAEGKALLETDEVIFRGDFRLKIPRREIRSAEAVGGNLHLTWEQGTAIFALGPQAPKWAQKILNPKSLLDKLDVKPEARVAVLGNADETFQRDLAERAVEISAGKPKKDTDMIFLAAESRDALEKLSGLEAYLRPDGAIWVVYPKGQKHITESDVRAAIKRTGRVDVKVVRFSETHTALKLVIPVKKRKAAVS
jgi:hypothetical protein